MLDIKLIRENPTLVQMNIEQQNCRVDIDLILGLDEKRRFIVRKVDDMKSERNAASKKIAEMKKKGEDASDLIAEMKEVSDKIQDLDDEIRFVDDNIESAMLSLPNLTHPSVPVGRSSNDNIEVRSWGEKQISQSGLDHLEICKKLGIVDFERGAKVTGGGFHYYIGKGAKLERALINFFLETHSDSGYTEIMAPFVVNENSMRGTGQLPKMAEDMYTMHDDKLYLIPTAEVPLTNFYHSEVLHGNDLPIKFCGYSPCFRREAGSYGKEVHGLLRVHQFNKVELVKFAKPDNSFEELEALTNDAENLIKALGLTYRVLLLCSGDTSFASSKTYDLEVWTPGENKWLEVSSCSNFLDFQARRANIRFKRDPNSKPEFVHTLNGSGLATPRIMTAILETYFDGEKVVIPEVLRKFTGFDSI
jgi:seryl-tRNA synthetase